MHVAGYEGVAPDEYRRRIRAWALYDWGNSAFATTILAAVLPIYYSRVAGETLASPAVATAYWTAGLSVALFFVAIASPILGTISDVRRGKKPLLAVFAGLGIVSTGLLVLVGSGDWLLASLFFVLGRIGFGAANVFYDALLPHVARPEDRDRVSSLGYALGYTGGGLLLAVNAVMIMSLGEIPGSRLSFLSVALWWAVFTIPVLRRVPEPPAATVATTRSVRASFARLGQTFRHLRRYRELLKYVISFFIYNDGIGTIIGVAAIYGAELGFAATELILALLLVQFVGIPFTLLFGRLPGHGELGRRPVVLAFVVFNLIALPVVGGIASRTLGADVVGRPGPAFETIDGAAGQEEWPVADPAVELRGSWNIVPGRELAGTRDAYAFTSDPDAEVVFTFNGREVEITHSRGPDHGGFLVELDGARVLDDDQPLRVDAYNTVERFGETEIVDAGEAGIHTLRLVNAGPVDEDATGFRLGIASLEVLEPTRESSLITVLGILAVLQTICAVLAFVFGGALFSKAAGALDTKRTILVALAVYSVVAVWGFFLDTVLEFWFLAWMVAMVQGGSQALSRSLYAAMSPASMSGEFFGLFSIMEKASAILGPFVFAGAVILFDSSRPAILMVVVFFLAGGYLLTRVDVTAGRRVAEEADRRGRA